MTDAYETGLKLRYEVQGKAYVEKALNGADAFNRDFQRLATEYCWGAVWGRDGLPKKLRSLLNLGMLAALNRQPEFKMHLHGALVNGLTLEEIREILLQISLYCGIPAGVEAFRIAREVFAERGIDVSQMDQASAGKSNA